MAIRVTLECGHSAVLRSKPTPEGYTHDWEVFVRGVNNADINHFVEKVVFQLHDTFPNPKRTIKSPPYIVKESGYAGFVIPIHIYLRNKDVPKKFITIHYDLILQHSGPAINTLTKHSEIFSNPSDEFGKLLLKGGATLVHNTEGPSDKFESKLTLPMTGKPKLSGADAKKHRPTEPKPVTTFTDLFGIPIKTGKISPDSNEKLSSDKSLAKQNLITDRNEKSERNQKSKHGQHKEMVKEKTSDERREKKDKESYSKDKSKERHKRALSPSSENQLSPKMKRTISPSPVRKPPSPKRSSSPKLKEKDSEKVKSEKEKEKEKMREAARNSEETKTERKKDKKRHKEDREKEKKDKHKEKERDKSKESKSSETEKTLEKTAEKQDKTRIEKGGEPKVQVKDEKKSPKAKEYEKVKEEKVTKIEKVDKIEKTEKKETKSSIKEKQQKHKHKKKDKKEKRDGSKDRERKEKRDKSKSLSDKSTSSSTASNNTNNALSALMAEVPGNDSESHSEDDSFENKPNVPSMKKEPEEPVAAEPVRLDEEFVKKEKSERHKRDKQSKLSRSEDRENREKKRKSELKLEEEQQQREIKKVRENSTSPALEPVSSSQSPVATESERIKEAYKDRESAQKALEREQEQVTPDSTNSALVDMESFESLGFSEDYVLQLKELQHKIMTLQDNNELQRVVQVIAETGQYEITTKTFDFDLCTLDRSTVQRLQKFFSGS